MLEVQAYGWDERTNERFHDQNREHEQNGAEIQSGKTRRNVFRDERVARIEKSAHERNADSIPENRGPRQNDVDDDDPLEYPKENEERERELNDHGKEKMTWKI